MSTKEFTNYRYNSGFFSLGDVSLMGEMREWLAVGKRRDGNGTGNGNGNRGALTPDGKMVIEAVAGSDGVFRPVFQRETGAGFSEQSSEVGMTVLDPVEVIGDEVAEGSDGKFKTMSEEGIGDKLSEQLSEFEVTVLGPAFINYIKTVTVEGKEAAIISDWYEKDKEQNTFLNRTLGGNFYNTLFSMAWMLEVKDRNVFVMKVAQLYGLLEAGKGKPERRRERAMAVVRRARNELGDTIDPVKAYLLPCLGAKGRKPGNALMVRIDDAIKILNQVLEYNTLDNRRVKIVK